MTNLKKTIAMLTALIMLVSLSACDRNNDDENGRSDRGERDPSIPTLDWEAADADAVRLDVNLRGNSSGNINNYGLAAVQGNWIYYVATNFQVFKTRADRVSAGVLVCGDYALWLNVIGEWVYYSSLYGGIHKIKTDSTEWTELTADNAGYVNVVGDWVYYSNGDDEGKIYKIKTDGTERTKLNDDESEYVGVVGNLIYYSNISDSGWEMYRIRTDGSDREVIIEGDTEYVTIVDNWIYYVNADDTENDDELGIFKINVNGSGKTRLTDDDGEYINVDDDGEWMYYSNIGDGGSIYRVRTDGTDKMKLNSDDSGRINLAGNWIYYSNFGDIDPETGSTVLYKMRPDGSERQIVS
ncbi:MAG: DUF5050 domain-containing protein [Oscillospiraceae bacterium]|nr:DUF5050 domain-containing protein [Oscillospiraceae bacterium]